MPYKSKAQQRFFHARLPELANKWDKETKNFSRLPEHIAEESNRLYMTRKGNLINVRKFKRI
jgi:hypothetical protein